MEKYHKNITLGGLILLLAGFFCLAGASSAIAQSATPIFQESFESLETVKANGATSYANLIFEPGRTGNGVRIRAAGDLKYPVGGKVDIHKGTIEFWVKPDWDGGTDLCRTGSGSKPDGWPEQRGPRHILHIFDGGDFWRGPHTIHINVNAYSPVCTPGQAVENIMAMYVQGALRQSREPYNLQMTWKPNTWHKVVLYWDYTLPDNTDGTHNSYFIAKIDDKYTDVLNVAPKTADTSDFLPDAMMVFGQDHIVGRYPADAVYDDFKIWDHSLLPVIPFPAYKFKPTDPASIANFYKLFANDGICSSFENFNTMPGDCPKLSDSVGSGKNFLFYQKAMLEKVVENTLPKAEEIKATMDYQAAQGQSADLFFNLYSRVNLSNVKVSTTAFTGPGGANISKDNLDLRVVKNWFQAGVGTFPDQLPRYVPELLLYNDQMSFDTDTTCTTYMCYYNPSIPKLDPIQTKIDQNTSKQFVILSKVPEGTPAGVYTSTVTLTADGFPAQTIQLRLEVLPFELKQTEKILMNNPPYMSAVAPLIATKEDYYSYHKEYYDIFKKTGFNALQVPFWVELAWFKNKMPLTDLFEAKLMLGKDYGIKYNLFYGWLNPTGPDINYTYEGLTSNYVDLFKKYSLEPWFYGVDEFCDDRSNLLCFRGGRTTTTMEEHVMKSKIIHSIGGKIGDSGGKESFDRLSDPQDPLYSPADMGIYPPGQRYIGEMAAGTATKTPNRLEGYYWQGEDEDPWRNRFFIGYLLWNSGLDVAWPFSWMGGNYHDFIWKPDKCCRNNTQVYGSQEGVVPTIQWEALREGINDLRYLETWKYYKDIVAQINPTLAAESQSVYEAVLDRHRDKLLSRDNMGAGFRVPMSQYEDDRKTIAAEIVRLKNATGGGSAPIISADLNADTKIDLADFNIFKLDFLKITASLVNPKSDINADGQATIRDIGIMMSQWRP